MPRNGTVGVGDAFPRANLFAWNPASAGFAHEGTALRTFSSELGAVAQQLSAVPRVYADANVPSGLVSFMRTRLHWDVLFVMEHDDLRRASDVEHFRVARQLHRTLVTLDRDYLDDRRFPPAEGPGVLVVSAPDEQLLARLLSRLDRALFRPRARRRGQKARCAPGTAAPDGQSPPAPSAPPSRRVALPLEGRKLHAHSDWSK